MAGQSCGACGEAIQAGSKFCAACGAPVVEAPPPSEAEAGGETRQEYLDRINSTKLGGPGGAGTSAAADSAAADSKKPNGCGIGCLIVVVLAVVAGIIGAISGGGGDSSSTPANGDAYGAYDVCQQFVDDRLKAPSTSDYPDIDEASITHRGRTWDVVAYVDAENGFGANIRVPFACTVIHTGDGNYRLVDVSLVE